jgi:hypothetical protein
MEPSRLFFRVRAVAFSLASLMSFLWVILLCIEAFSRWDISPVSERGIIVVLLLTDTITVIMLPVLILVKFRAWLDGARLLLLFVLHTGCALVFTILSPDFECPDQTVDDQDLCRLINIYILLASWVNPGLLLAYCSYFAFAVYHSKPKSHTLEDSKSISDDADMCLHSSLPTQPAMTARSTLPITPVWPISELISESSLASDNNNRISVSTGGRLSKPLPWVF